MRGHVRAPAHVNCDVRPYAFRRDMIYQCQSVSVGLLEAADTRVKELNAYEDH